MAANDPYENPELARKNLRWGFALLGVFLLLALGTLAVGLVYLALVEPA